MDRAQRLGHRFEHTAGPRRGAGHRRVQSTPLKDNHDLFVVRAFVGHPNVLLSREKLIELAPGESHDVDTKAIDNRIARLRAKLDTELIVTVRGRGYMFVPSVDADRR